MGFLMGKNVTIVSWNIGGVGFLKTDTIGQTQKKERINQAIKNIINSKNPDFILLQEIVKYKNIDIIEAPNDYNYTSTIAIDTKNNKHPVKWDQIIKEGNWSKSDYLGQGMGILWKSDIPHCHIWETNINNATHSKKLEMEKIHIETGLFVGDRDTEPRVIVVSHFILHEKHIFLVNIHLTTLRGEREGFPKKDEEGINIRLNQIGIILNGIVSRYNEWRNNLGIISDRRALWFLVGDFNATPSSEEITRIKRRNFTSLCRGYTKRSKDGGAPMITVDYIFAGPKYYSFNPKYVNDNLEKIDPMINIIESDHVPIVAKFPIQ